MDSKDALTWFGLGLALRDAGDYPGADAAFRQVVELEEYGELADRAKEAPSPLAERTFRSVIPGVERPDAVTYCVGALHLLCIMHVAFKKFAPDMDIGFDLSAEYEKALERYQSGAATR